MKCVIAGSRSLGLREVNGKLIQMTLDECSFIEDAFTKCDWSCKITEIVSGTARGVDVLGEQLAEKLGLELIKFPANWGEFGKGAGHIRNGDMAKYADIAIVLWDGHSRGSANMIKQMGKHGKPCIVYLIRGGKIYESD